MSWKTPLLAVVPGKPVTGVLGPQGLAGSKGSRDSVRSLLPTTLGAAKVDLLTSSRGDGVGVPASCEREEAPWTLV